MCYAHSEHALAVHVCKYNSKVDIQSYVLLQLLIAAIVPKYTNFTATSSDSQQADLTDELL